MNPIRILIADDHPVFRFGLRSLIASIPEMEVVGEATNGESAIEAAIRLKPDIILMDINMPGLNGIQATRRILADSPEIGILVITMFDDDSVFDAMQAGARGYLLKGADPEETVRAIHSVANGEAIFSPKVAERLISYFGKNQAAASPNAFPELTERESEVLDLIAQGLTNTAIAERLVLSPKTVRNHVSNIFSKLQVSDRAQAIIRARQAGLGKDKNNG
jgi:DNA-binding NarL/FixJ family response regulator